MGEGGLASLELVLAAVPVIAVIMVVVFGGRLVVAEGTLDGAAHYAARQAAAARSDGQAASVAEAAASQNLADSGLPCAVIGVDVDTSQFRPGGTVRVEVACEVDLSDLTPLPLPGTRRMASSSAAVVDVFRGTE